MIPAILLSRALTTTRRFAPTVLAAVPGRLVTWGAGVLTQLESQNVVDTFQCRDLEGLSRFLDGLRGNINVVSDGQCTFLAASDRRLEVESLTRVAANPRTALAEAFTIPVSRPRLRLAVERFGRKDTMCLLHYTRDALCLDDELGSSSISDYRRSSGPERITRGVSGKLLRGVAMVLRTNEVEMRILGDWNAAGPVVLSECGDVSAYRLTIAFPADSYKRVRLLLLRANAQPQPEESIYTGLTEQQCEALAAHEDRQHTMIWLETRAWERGRLREMADDQDRRRERAELLEHLEWEAHKHRKEYANGCGLAGCDVCAADSSARGQT